MMTDAELIEACDEWLCKKGLHMPSQETFSRLIALARRGAETMWRETATGVSVGENLLWVAEKPADSYNKNYLSQTFAVERGFTYGRRNVTHFIPLTALGTPEKE